MLRYANEVFVSCDYDVVAVCSFDVVNAVASTTYVVLGAAESGPA